MCQCRPADPTDPGDAADLSIMGYQLGFRPVLLVPTPVLLLHSTVAQDYLKINTFLTTARESLGLR